MAISEPVPESDRQGSARKRDAAFGTIRNQKGGLPVNAQTDANGTVSDLDYKSIGYTSRPKMAVSLGT